MGGELWAMLKAGNIDFVGQKQSYDFQFYVIWTSGVIGFLVGYVNQRFLYTFYCVFGASLVVTILCLPAWPIWNRHPANGWSPTQMKVKKRMRRRTKRKTRKRRR